MRRTLGGLTFWLFLAAVAVVLGIAIRYRTTYVTAKDPPPLVFVALAAVLIVALVLRYGHRRR